MFKVCASDNYEFLTQIEDEDLFTIIKLQGRKINPPWIPVMLHLERESNIGLPLLRSDFPWLSGGALIMRDNVVPKMEHLWRHTGSLLPISTDSGEVMYLLHLNCIGEIWNYKYSDIKYFRDQKRIMFVKKAVLRKDLILQDDVFQDCKWPSAIFVTEYFIKVYQNLGLCGLKFEPVERA